MTVRAKFRCTSVETRQTDAHGKLYKFDAVYDPSIPEDQRFATATPWGHMEINVTNPAVTFTPGTSYYLDLIEVPTE